MKNYSIAGIVIFTVALFCFTPPPARADWKGVDETVVEKYARQAGRPSRAPFINTDSGDMLLFVFLLAGTAGGFAMGYTFRILFHEKKPAVDKGGKDADD